MKKLISDMLICPICLPFEISLKLNIDEIEGEDILKGALVCNRCGAKYRIEEGIAILTRNPEWEPDKTNKYENPQVVSSYIWSHYGDLLNDKEWLPAYNDWASLIDESKGFSLDIGCAVGRFTFQMAMKSDFSLGIDMSFSFIKVARQLMKERVLKFELKQEGLINIEVELNLPESIKTDNLDFIVADALSLPFPKNLFTKVASLNIVDKVPFPINHIKEMDRVSAFSNAQILISDPYSWSEEVARIEDWLGGKEEGEFKGFGQDNVAKILEGFGGYLEHPWKVVDRGTIIWKIRNHRNHSELIKSLYVKAIR